jgi:hypothetical protein
VAQAADNRYIHMNVEAEEEDFRNCVFNTLCQDPHREITKKSLEALKKHKNISKNQSKLSKKSMGIRYVITAAYGYEKTSKKKSAKTKEKSNG